MTEKPTLAEQKKHWIWEDKCHCKNYQKLTISLIFLILVMTYMYYDLGNTFRQYKDYQEGALTMLVNNIMAKADAKVDCERQSDILKAQLSQYQNQTCPICSTPPLLPPCESEIVRTMEQMCVNKTVIGVDCNKFNEWNKQINSATIMPCEAKIIENLKELCSDKPMMQMDCQTIMRWKYGM